MNYCGHCGWKLRGNETYCPCCGKELTNVVTEDISTNNQKNVTAHLSSRDMGRGLMAPEGFEQYPKDSFERTLSEEINPDADLCVEFVRFIGESNEGQSFNCYKLSKGSDGQYYLNESSNFAVPQLNTAKTYLLSKDLADEMFQKMNDLILKYDVQSWSKYSATESSVWELIQFAYDNTNIQISTKQMAEKGERMFLETEMVFKQFILKAKRVI